jgi:hypothetical protein
MNEGILRVNIRKVNPGLPRDCRGPFLKVETYVHPCTGNTSMSKMFHFINLATNLSPLLKKKEGYLCLFMSGIQV